MNRLLVGAIGVVLVAGCPKPAVSPAPAPTPSPDAAPAAAATGWTQGADGAWTFALDQDAARTPDSFSATPGDFTAERFTLPPGVSSATIASIDVVYATGGQVTWSVRADDDGWFADDALAEVTADVTANHQWTHHVFEPAPTVQSPFWIAFTSPSTDPSKMVAVTASDLLGVDPDQEWQPDPALMPVLWQSSNAFGQRAFPAQLYVRVTLH